MVIGLSLTANCWLFTGFEYRQILPSQVLPRVERWGGGGGGEKWRYHMVLEIVGKI